MDVWTWIGDHHTSVLVVGGLGFLLSAGYVAWRTVLAPPAARPASDPAPRPSSVVQGELEHQVRGQAQTQRLPVNEPLDPAAEARRQAARMEELGFHRPTERSRSDLAAAEATTAAVVAPSIGVALAARQATESPKPAAEAQAQDSAPDEADLDDILSRIDRVLSDNPVMATHTMAPGSVDTDVTTNPATDQPKEPDQQKLF